MAKPQQVAVGFELSGSSDPEVPALECELMAPRKEGISTTENLKKKKRCIVL